MYTVAQLVGIHTYIHVHAHVRTCTYGYVRILREGWSCPVPVCFC